MKVLASSKNCSNLQKVILFHFLVILSQIELEKVISS